MNQPNFTLSGAVDLGARKAAADQQAEAQNTAGQAGRANGAQGGSPHVINVTEETFNTEVVERSRQVPVVIDFWADWCQPCKQLSPVLEKLAGEGGGRWILAKVDVDANQQLASALQVQSLPTVMAVVGGQGVNGFQGALPEDQVRQWIDQLMAAVSGQAPPEQEGAEGEPQQQAPDEVTEAADAIDRGDLDGATAAYQRLLDRAPGDPTAAAGLQLVELLRRTGGVDEQAARRQAAEAPDDVATQSAVADFDMLAGRVEDAFDRLVGAVRRTSGDEREQARTHLLKLFDVVPDTDQRVIKARQALARALF